MRGATLDEGIAPSWRVEKLALKLFGYGTPNRRVGLFFKQGTKMYYNIVTPELPVVISLTDEFYDLLILGVANPRELVDQINNLGQ